MNENNILNRLYNFIFPMYDEITLYLFSLIPILFFIVNFKSVINYILSELNKTDFLGVIAFIVFLLFIIVLIGLPILNAFSKRTKKEWEKGLMLVYVIFIDFFIAKEAYDVIIDKASNWDKIIPLINVIHAGIVFIGLRLGFVSIDRIADENANFIEVLLSSILVVSIFILYNYIFNKHWAITFSICIFYSYFINKILMLIFKTIKKYL